MQIKKRVQMLQNPAKIFLLAAVLGSFTVNCQNGTAYVEGDVKPKGLVSMKMTDYPLNDKDIKAVFVEIRRIEINTATGWKTVIDYGDQGKVLDLLTLTNGRTADLGFFQLELGTYDQIRLYLNDNNHVVTADATGLKHEPLKVPSGVQTGIKLVRSFSVTESGTTEILVDFNAEKSISFNKGQGYMLQPTIKVLGVTTTPGVSKVIRAAEGGEISILNDVSISIPPGSLSEDTVVSILPQESAVTTQEQHTVMDLKSYQFLPEGIQMSKDATVTMHYDPTEMDAMNAAAGENLLSETLLDIAYFDPTQNKYISNGRVLDKQSNTVITSTNHFSTWSLVLAVPLLVLPRLVDLATWEARVNDYLQNKDSYGTTTVDPNYNGAYIGFTSLFKNPNDTSIRSDSTANQIADMKAKLKADVYADYGTYVGNYYPGYPMDARLFVLSQHVEVNGYVTSVHVGKLLADATFAAFIFFHDAQRHDLCNSFGYGTYRKDYSMCNQDLNEDMQARCDLIKQKIKDPVRRQFYDNKCRAAAGVIKTSTDLHYWYNYYNAPAKNYGNGCDDYDFVYDADRHKYCVNGRIDFSIMPPNINGVTLTEPGNITSVSITKNCPIFELPELHITWDRPASWGALGTGNYRTVELSKNESSDFILGSFLDAIFAFLFPWAVPPVYDAGSLATVRDRNINASTGTYIDKFDIGGWAKYNYSIYAVNHYNVDVEDPKKPGTYVKKHIPVPSKNATLSRYCNPELLNFCWIPNSCPGATLK